MKRILVCGGRDFGLVPMDDLDPLFERRVRERKFVQETLSNLFSDIDDLVIISGAARGVDTIAIDWAKHFEIDYIPRPANWIKYGRGAGTIRNREMLELKPDLIIAFPGGPGTRNMKDIARAVGIPVKEIDYDDSAGQLTF